MFALLTAASATEAYTRLDKTNTVCLYILRRLLFAIVLANIHLGYALH